MSGIRGIQQLLLVLSVVCSSAFIASWATTNAATSAATLQEPTSAGGIHPTVIPTSAITKFQKFSSSSFPNSLIGGPDGNVWFTDDGTNAIGRIRPSGIVTEFPISTANSAPQCIIVGPDRNLWFIEQLGHKIGRITTSGTISEYPVPTARFQADCLVLGPDGNLWFPDSGTNQLGRITPAGQITFPLPEPSVMWGSIAFGPDGSLWNLGGSGQVTRITPSGVVSQLTVPTSDSDAGGMMKGPDGNLWFTEYTGEHIGRIAPSGNPATITEIPVPTPGAGPVNISDGPDGNLWFTEFYSQIGRITTAGVVTEYQIPDQDVSTVAAGPGGELWCIDSQQGVILRINLAAIGSKGAAIGSKGAETSAPTATPSRTPSFTPSATIDRPTMTPKATATTSAIVVAKPAPASGGNRHIVFLPGICPTSNGVNYAAFGCSAPTTPMNAAGRATAATMFGPLLQALQHAGVRYAPYYYSYPDAKNYQKFSRFNAQDTYLATDTHVSLSADAKRLNAQIQEILTNRKSPNYDPHATFDLVGDGLGGVVAAYWVVAYATPSELTRVHSLTTFDSPIHGISGAVVKQVGGYWSGSVATDLLHGMQAKAIAAINDPGRGLLAKLPHALTLADIQDGVVGPEFAWIGVRTAPWNLVTQDCSPAQTPCSLSVLHDAAAAACAADWIISLHPNDTEDFGLRCSLTNHFRPLPDSQLPNPPFGPGNTPLLLSHGSALKKYLGSVVTSMRYNTPPSSHIAVLGTIVSLNGTTLVVRQALPQVAANSNGPILFHDQVAPIGSDGTMISVEMTHSTRIAVDGGLGQNSVGMAVIVGGTVSRGVLVAELIADIQPTPLDGLKVANTQSTGLEGIRVADTSIKGSAVARAKGSDSRLPVRSRYTAQAPEGLQEPIRSSDDQQTLTFEDEISEPAMDLLSPTYSTRLNNDQCSITVSFQLEGAFSTGFSTNFPMNFSTSASQPPEGSTTGTFDVSMQDLAPSNGTSINEGISVAGNLNFSFDTCLGKYDGLSIGIGEGFEYTSHDSAPMPGTTRTLNTTQCAIGIPINLKSLSTIAKLFSIKLDICPNLTLEGAPVSFVPVICSNGQGNNGCPLATPSSGNSFQPSNIDPSHDVSLSGDFLSPTTWLDLKAIQYHPIYHVAAGISIEIGKATFALFGTAPIINQPYPLEANPGQLGFSYSFAGSGSERLPTPPTNTPTPITTPTPTNTATGTSTPTNTPVSPAQAPFQITIAPNPSTVPVGQANQLCITISRAASVVISGSDNGGPSYSIGTQQLDAGTTCFTSAPLTVPGTTVITAVGTPTDGSGSASGQATVTIRPGVTTAPITPGGVWQTPNQGDTATGTLHFSAEAYPTNPGDPPIAYTNFTIGWPAANPTTWVVACTEYNPTSVASDGHAVYSCNIDLSTLNPAPPPGQLAVSFDVYDQAGHINKAPNGEHIITYQLQQQMSGPSVQVSPASGAVGSMVCFKYTNTNGATPTGIIWDGELANYFPYPGQNGVWIFCRPVEVAALQGTNLVTVTDSAGGSTSTTYTVTDGAGVLLGGLPNLDGYCQASGYGSAALSGTTWNCRANDGSLHAIFMVFACQWQYHNSVARAWTLTANDPNSWLCYDPPPGWPSSEPGYDGPQ